MNFSADNARELRHRLEDAAIKCSERCLYHSAKWYGAEYKLGQYPGSYLYIVIAQD